MDRFAEIEKERTPTSAERCTRKERFLASPASPGRLGVTDNVWRKIGIPAALRRLFGLLRRFDVGGAVAEETRRGNGLGKDDADGDKDCSAAGSKGNGHLDASAFWILIATAEGDPAF